MSKKLLILFAIMSFGFMSFTSVHAANIVVDTTGIVGSPTECTLEDAIEAHETSSAVKGCTAGTGTDTIELTAVGRYKPSTTMTIETGNLTITAADANQFSISGEEVNQIFAINADGPVTINGITLINGKKDIGGAIHAYSPLILTNSKLVNNKGTLTAGAINMTFASSGPNASRTNPTLTIDNVEAYFNDGNVAGGVISVVTLSVGYTTPVSISRFTAYSNTADRGSVMYLDTNTNTTITNSTIINNKANNIGAISTFGFVNLVNNTFNNNLGGVFEDRDGPINLKNNIFANNDLSKICYQDDTNIISDGHNISSDNKCAAILDHVSDLNNLGELYLAPLVYGTSFVPVQALLKNSPAIDSGDNTDCPSTDARGINRPFNSTCDIGAYELDKAPSAGVFRFFNTRNGEHFLTIDAGEANFIRTDPGMNVQWNYEGINYPVDENSNGSNIPVHRFLQKSTGYHHFTSDSNEVSVLQGLSDWDYEGIKFYAYDTSITGSAPVYRFFNKVNGQHLFTISSDEAEFLRNSEYGMGNWNDEGIEYFVAL